MTDVVDLAAERNRRSEPSLLAFHRTLVGALPADGEVCELIAHRWESATYRGLRIEFSVCLPVGCRWNPIDLISEDSSIADMELRHSAESNVELRQTWEALTVDD